MRDNQGLAFLKGQGTGNDFVILPDVDDQLNLTAELVMALCDRRFGIGADGVLRVVRASADQGAEYFMDYRNSDGSIAQMCGNGARVFGRYLVDAGLVAPGEFPVVTRAGVRTLRVPAAGDVSVSMGPVTVGDKTTVVLTGSEFPGVTAWVGNPHVVCIVGDSVLDDLDLTNPPELDPVALPEGANVEFCEVLASDRVQMRVFERGSGETLSCGTGACAAAIVAGDADSVTVVVPGGEVRVERSRDVQLIGPASIVAAGQWFG